MKAASQVNVGVNIDFAAVAAFGVVVAVVLLLLLLLLTRH